MFNLFILFNSLILSFLFNQISHPLSMGMILIIQTIMISLMIGMISPSFWFSYIIFLIFIGGMLILFMYTISIISNEKFNFLWKKNILWLMSMITMFLFFFLMKFNFLNYSFSSNNELMLMSEKNLKLESSMNMIKFFNYPNNIINLMMMMYLFFLLIVTVYLTNFFLGPMRQK